MPKKENYKVVSLLDVNELLSFAKEEMKSIESQIKEEARVEEELKGFIKKVEHHSGHKINYIGHEKRFGKHLVRFLFKDGGLLEVIVEKPLTINGHFINDEKARKFAEGLKKALHQELPDNPIKEILIDSIKVEDGFKDEVISVDKWGQLHKFTIKKTLATTVVVLFIFIVIELTKAYFTETARELFHFESFIVTLVTSILIALFIEPIREKVEHIVGKVLNL